MQLHEKYRPASLADIVGNNETVSMIRGLLESPTWDRDAFFIQGPSGSGKTTLARIVAATLTRGSKMDVFEIAGADCTIEAVKEIETQSGLSAWGQSGWKVWIIDEANAMSSKAVQGWKTLLDRPRAKRLYIFTSARQIDTLFETGDESGQLSSRCKVFDLAPDREAWAARVQQIARAEGLDGKPLAEYVTLLESVRDNFRAALQKVECGSMKAAAKPIAPKPHVASVPVKPRPVPEHLTPALAKCLFSVAAGKGPVGKSSNIRHLAAMGLVSESKGQFTVTEQGRVLVA